MSFATILTSPNTLLPSRQTNRGWKRRRLKPIQSHLNMDHFFHTFLTQFPSTTALTYAAAPTIGLFSGLALYLSSKQINYPKIEEPEPESESDLVLDDWILFTTPTPFNRFVILRCPTIYLPDANSKLVSDDRHFVKLKNDTIVDTECDLVYQRVCVSGEDGGVLSLDWPDELELEEERGLDTTVLIVPGTCEGSGETKVRLFVKECLGKGLFPVVVNPRGCAGSPLTTARLFTAADSDDISTAVHFINKKRPWTTLVGVAWGFGANMLTKYLAESGERTPLIAATCIDNPFDLEENARSLIQHMDFDRQHTSGLISILQRNKELFQARGKGFDVEKAMSASSIRDFEESISMLSYGFHSIEEFYEQSSTRKMVGKVKIPVLFIQSGGGTVPMFSVPRGSIAANPYTSLLLCSYSPFNKVMDARFTSPWCHHLTLEWLTAVELGLLKGRHPLLKDFDYNINPSKSLTLVDSKASTENGRTGRLLSSHSMNSTSNVLEVDAPTRSIKSVSNQDKGETIKSSDSKKEDDSVSNKFSAIIDAEIVNEETNSTDEERGKVLASAQVVINMLDVTMPEILSDEQKKKVLSAVGQGETLMKALQDAVPEDVRGKLTSGVTGILQSRGSDLKLDKLLNLGRIPDVAEGVKAKQSISNSDNIPISDPKITSDGSTKNDNGSDKPSENVDSEMQSSKDLTSRSSEKDKVTDPNIIKGDGLNGQTGENSNKHDSSTDDNKGPEKMHTENQSVAPSPASEAQMPESETQNSQKEVKEPASIQSSEKEEKGPVSVRSSDKDEKEPVPVISPVSETQESGQSSQKEEKESPSVQSSVKEETEASIQSSEKEEKGPVSVQSSDKDEKEPVPVISPVSETQESGQSSQKEEKESPSVQSSVKEEKEASIQSSEKEEKGPVSVQSSEKDEKEPVPVPSPETQESEQSSQKEEKEPPSVQSGVKEEKDPVPVQSSEKEGKERVANPNQSSAAPPRFNVSQALDALTGFDDSTQVAVNSVFQTIESMLDQLEVDKHKENKVNNENIKDERTGLDEVKEQRGTSSSDRLTVSEKSSESVVDNAVEPSSDLHESATSEGECENATCVATAAAATAAELSEKNFAELLNSSSEKFPSYFPYDDPLYKEYLKRFLSSKMRKTKPPDLDKSSALHLNYVPEEDQWKLLDEQSADDNVSLDKLTMQKSKHANDIIEPSYSITDSKKPSEQTEELTETRAMNENIDFDLTKFDLSMPFIRNFILERLNVEVGRRASGSTIEELELKLVRDIEHVADAVYLAVENRKLYDCYTDKDGDDIPDEQCTITVENIIEAISSAYQETHYLKSVLPVGVVVGSTLASLRELCEVASLDVKDKKSSTRDQVDKLPETIERVSKETEPNNSFGNLSDDEDTVDAENSNNQVMVGAVTAALGASALFIHQQATENDATSNGPMNGKENNKDPSTVEGMSGRARNNIVTSLAEKAMSVASPVMPTKEDGGVDHERLVAMLAEWGQRGGALRLVGKLALLWGGIRGAMSLTDKLISFLKLSERPLLQRILGFVLLVILLWSPVLVPLLPSLMQGWATHSPLKIVEFACIGGLYVSAMFMVTLWGKRIRNYDAPLQQYGLDLASLPKFQNFLKGLIGGGVLVLLIHSVNSLLGCVNLCWPTTLSSLPLEPMMLIGSYGRMFLLVVQGIATATGIAIVEEVLFRSWLPQEIEVDLGYHRGIVISGLVFALIQRSIWEIPGLWLLSLSLAGARKMSQGSLSLPIGIRAGILASNYVLRRGGFLTFQPSFPVWMTGGHSLQPFSGVVGLAFSVVLAIILYPKQPLHRRKPTRAIIP